MVAIGCLFPMLLQAATIEVCHQCQINSISVAVAHVAPGDTVLLRKGVYAEGMVTITSPLHIQGDPGAVLDGRHEKHVIDVRADNVTIDGLTIQNSGESDIEEFAGIYVDGVKNCRITRNQFLNNTYSIYLAKADSCLIGDNVAVGNAKNEVSGGNGLHSWYSKNLTIRHNVFKNHRDGLYFEFTNDSVIDSNVSTHNVRYGLHFMYSQRDRYLNNTFSENQTGVAVMYSHNIVMQGNTFEKSWGRASYGMLIKDITDSVIENNRFLGNTVGLYSDDSNRNKVLGNLFQHNGWAVNMLGNSDSNVFEKNEFVSNYFNVVTDSKDNNNEFSGNYWSDYRGYDLNHDGVGDVPFRPMKVFSLWISRYPELVALLESPVIDFLEMAERIFPVLTPKLLQDNAPQMKAVRL